MPQIEQAPANKLYRYAIGEDKTPRHQLYSLAEFWALYKNTFKPVWDANGVTYGQPRDVTVTLIAPWGELVVYPLPNAIGTTRRRIIQDAIDADKRQCYQCESWFDKDAVEAVSVDRDTELYCETCKDAIPVCDRCNEHTTETHSVDGDSWCESCRDDHAVRCDDCRDWFDADDNNGMSHGSDWYCESCSEIYSTCDTCGTLLSTDNQYSDSNGEGTYCERHQPSDDEESDNDFIHDYSYNPRPIFHGTGIHYGVELEVTCDRDSAEDTIDVLGGDSHVYLKNDSSIGGGYEIVTHPHTLDSHRKLWAGFNDYARRMGFKANSNGMHVHIDRAKLSPYRIAIMQRFINRDDNRAFIGFIAQRSDSSWAKCNPDLAKMRASGNGQRYSALNLNNAKTVEIRIFRGTIRKSEFLKNLEFCDALVQWSIDRSHAETSVSDFAVYVRANRKVYPALDAFMTDGGHLPAMPVKKEVPACV